MRHDNGIGSQTVDRALAVLTLLVEAKGSITLDRLTAMAGMHRSNVYRLLRSLEGAGFVTRDGEAGGYNVGPTDRKSVV